MSLLAVLVGCIGIADPEGSLVLTTMPLEAAWRERVIIPKEMADKNTKIPTIFNR